LAAPGVSDLAWSDGAGIAFGGIFKVTKKVQAADTPVDSRRLAAKRAWA
jgi:hypothetical protein